MQVFGAEIILNIYSAVFYIKFIIKTCMNCLYPIDSSDFISYNTSAADISEVTSFPISAAIHSHKAAFSLVSAAFYFAS
jgi:hypothetical protein